MRGDGRRFEVAEIRCLEASGSVQAFILRRLVRWPVLRRYAPRAPAAQAAWSRCANRASPVDRSETAPYRGTDRQVLPGPDSGG
jgi:hypothetical protein